MRNINIEEGTSELISKPTNIWEKYVKETHLFLSELEIAEIKLYIPTSLQNIQHLIVTGNEDVFIVGFICIENIMIEMLFISPEHHGKGIGKKFIQYGIETLSINEVTVNQ